MAPPPAADDAPVVPEGGSSDSEASVQSTDAVADAEVPWSLFLARLGLEEVATLDSRMYTFRFLSNNKPAGFIQYVSGNLYDIKATCSQAGHGKKCLCWIRCHKKQTVTTSEFLRSVTLWLSTECETLDHKRASDTLKTSMGMKVRPA